MDFNERIEHLFEEYKKQRNSLTELQRQMREISASETSARQEVTVTVGQGGVLTDIRFPTSAYKRLTPAELTATIMQTFAEAKEAALEQAATIIAPMLPDGLNAKDMVNGSAGVDAYLPPDGPRMATSVREILGLGRVAK